ncbi:GNAT family N-acetyltransferase [Amycolatopsis sp. lyj-23]|uniref:GNAT family N-acetyltransferase n=1 Tax=Amycolatopsis sp. lyj-23 TaxID=2789283 RepID=UPI00397B57D0
MSIPHLSYNPKLELHLPVKARSATTQEPSEPDWLSNIRSFRARVLWSRGRRPAFRTADGRFVDADTHDTSAYHLVLREPARGDILACVRCAPLERLRSSRVRSLAPEAASQLLRGAEISDSDVLEGARLVVEPTWQRSGLGSRLLVAETALAQLLGRRLVWGTMGCRQGQDRFFAKFGRTPLGEQRFTLPQYDDEVVIMIGRPEQVPSHLEGAVASARAELRSCFDKHVTSLAQPSTTEITGH